MNIRYTVHPCDNGDLQQVDRDGFEDDISDYIDQIDQQPRGRRPQNHTVLVRVCKKLTDNNTQSVNSSIQAAERQCHLRKVAVTSQSRRNPNMVSEGEIPTDILEEIERDGKYTVAQNGTEPGEKPSDRQRRQAEENWTDSYEASEGAGSGRQREVENSTDTSAEVKPVERDEMPSEKNGTNEELKDSNEIYLNSEALLNQKFSTVEPVLSEEMDENLSQNHIQSEPERLRADMMDLEYNYTASNNTTSLDLALDYDDYSEVSFFFLRYLLSTYMSHTIPYTKY